MSTQRQQPYPSLSNTYFLHDSNNKSPPTIEVPLEHQTEDQKPTKENYINTNPSVWGPKFWFTLHNGALNYPSLANPLCIERMKNFIMAIPIMIPCFTCKEHANSYIEGNKEYLDHICSSRDNLFKFFVDFHNYVNIRQNKPILSYDDAYKLYDQ